jgi:hypothetical protein
MRSGSLDVEVDDTDVLELLSSSDESVEQYGGGGRRAVDIDLVA